MGSLSISVYRPGEAGRQLSHTSVAGLSVRHAESGSAVRVGQTVADVGVEARTSRVWSAPPFRSGAQCVADAASGALAGWFADDGRAQMQPSVATRPRCQRQLGHLGQLGRVGSVPCAL